jgi:Mg2+/Co2+ transporter CorC
MELWEVLSSISTNDIPLEGELITIGSYHFVIEEATNKKIELVKMTIIE